MRFNLFAVGTVLALASGCGSHKATSKNEPLYDLTINASSFSDWAWTEGKEVTLKVYDGDQEDQGAQQAEVVNGAFSVAWTACVEAGVTYTVRYYIDQDQDGMCDNGDPGFSSTFAATSGANTYTLPIPSQDQAQNLCSYFSP